MMTATFVHQVTCHHAEQLSPPRAELERNDQRSECHARWIQLADSADHDLLDGGWPRCDSLDRRDAPNHLASAIDNTVHAIVLPVNTNNRR
jgi:hypothetical protein